MKLPAGMYKIPVMFPKTFSFPGGYTLINNLENFVQVTLMATTNKEDIYYEKQVTKGEHINIFLKDGFLCLDGECEIFPFNPEE